MGAADEGSQARDYELAPMRVTGNLEAESARGGANIGEIRLMGQ